MSPEQLARYRMWQPLLLGIVASMGFWAGLKVRVPQYPGEPVRSSTPLPADQGQKIQDVVSYVQAHYADSVNLSQQVDNAISSYVTQLNPYAEYLSSEQMLVYGNILSGKVSSVGMELLLVDSNLYALNVSPDGPAAKLGIRNGDQFDRLDGWEAPFAFDAIASRLDEIAKAKRDSIVFRLADHKRAGNEVRILRFEEQQQPSLSNAFPLDEATCYLAVRLFTKGVYREFMQALEACVSSRGRQNIVIDLRGNRGGMVGEAASILNQFVKNKGELLFLTRGFHAGEREYLSLGNAFFELDRIAVLTDSVTASAAELFAQVLRRRRGAVIVGDTTYGKDAVLETFRLGDGSAIVIPVSRYLVSRKPDYEQGHRDTASVGDAHSNPGFQQKSGARLVPDSTLLPANPDEVLSVEVQKAIDAEVARGFSFFQYLVRNDINKIFADKRIGDRILTAYEQLDPTIQQDLKYTHFETRFRYRLCRWLFGRESEQSARLERDPVVKAAMSLLKQPKL
ncbi:MAG: hypothetical protein KBF37_06935 [Saprospiraceae bacterium]|jgi:C-terminal peptidase prc|nr:hypothetical protein [Saprospiraceae bacterium]MBV6472883.1 hypothetical protein [Saprospiraceae bacterium]